MIIISIYIFVLGLIIGSFLNAVIYRLEVGGSLIKERSRCPLCKHTLSWYELIPVLSFIFQGGRCTKCKKAISWQYPIVEILTGSLFAFAFFYINNSYLLLDFSAFFELSYLLLILSFLVLIFVFDWKHYIIPNIAIYSLIIISFFYNLYIFGFSNLLPYLMAVFIASGFFLFLYVVSSGRWIGMGDVKYGVFMGLFLGINDVLVGLFLSYTIGAIIGSFLLLGKNKGLKSEVPFGPFLIVGTLLAYFYGNYILNWYLGMVVF